MPGSQSSDHEEETGEREFRANGNSMKTAEVEAKLDEGNIQEAESSLREGLSLNFEEARALLGRLEYQRGNVEGALRVFEGIDLQAAIQRFQPPLGDKTSKRGRSRTESMHSVPQHSANLVLEAIYLKAKSLQKLGRLTEAAGECKSVLDAVEKIFQNGIPDLQVDGRLQETVRQAVELLPELLKQAGSHDEAIATYRRALLSQWSLDNDCCARIQKNFAVFLLYSGVEAAAPSLSVQIDGSYIPRNNLEEAILLLMILIRKYALGKIKWDPSVMEHLTFALSLCSQTSVLARQLEEVMPGTFNRIDRWIALALCHSGALENKEALNLLRKALHDNERPNDLMALLLAAKICSEDPLLAAEGVSYARRALTITSEEHFKGVALRVLGLCLGKQAKVSSSDYERSSLQLEALKSLEEAINFEFNNPDLLLELAVQYAEHRNVHAALRYAKQFIDATGGSILKGWRLLALILSSQKRYSEAQVVIDAALDETAKWEQGPLLRMKAKLKIFQSLPMDAIETYRYLLALVQAQRKSFGPVKANHQVDDDKVNEFEVWLGLANLYSNLSHWKDVEVCLEKALSLRQFSAATLHTEGNICIILLGAMYEGQGLAKEALAAYANAVLLDPNYVPCKILLGALLLKMGPQALPVARNVLSDALRLEPTNRNAWYYLGMVHRDDGRNGDAAECFQAASMLEESEPIESFSSVL
ncbi:Protein NPG1 [Bienertia sinuspersici]